MSGKGVSRKTTGKGVSDAEAALRSIMKPMMESFEHLKNEISLIEKRTGRIEDRVNNLESMINDRDEKFEGITSSL